MQIIKTIAELDAKIVECNEAEKRSEDAMRAIMGGFRMDVPLDLPSDPFSPEYREAQLRLYRDITGNAYSTQSEATKFDVASMAAKPFPFYTKSSAVAGEYFMAIGFVLHAMGLPPGSRVLEFGAGWGYTSLALALLGHKVTVIDIEPCFCELIQTQARRAGVAIEVVNAEFFSIETMAREFDAVLFYDCFHHCDDHMRLLHALKKVVAEEGRLFFGAEPITPDFPMPWGIRLDGWALWGVRKNGWMELGFHDEYFAKALVHTGWFGRKISIAGLDRLRIWEAKHISAAQFRFPANSPKLRSKIGRREEKGIVLENALAGMALFGPYLDLPAGRYRARIGFADAAANGRAVMDVTCDNGRKALAKRDLVFSNGKPATAELEFSSAAACSGVEVRLACRNGFTGTIAGLTIEPLP
jgi:ubiquinone/menaquinone biosynthesis C-methylase UbiE